MAKAVRRETYLLLRNPPIVMPAKAGIQGFIEI